MKLKHLIQSQLPEFVTTDYPKLVRFMQAYYEWLETQLVDVVDVVDVDTTPDAFVQEFKNYLASNIPSTASVDPKLLVKHASDLYVSKGSEKSFEALFRILFNKPVSVQYPSHQIFKTSDGRWYQEFSLFVNVTYGNIDDLIGRTITIRTSNGDVRLNPIGYKSVEVNGLLSTSVFELMINKNEYRTNIAPGNLVIFDSFRGTIGTTTSSIKVAQGGKGFIAGETYTIKAPSDTPSIIKINTVDDNGSITRASIIKFGVGYAGDFTFTLVSNKYARNTKGTTSVIGGNVQLADSVGFGDEGVINSSDYNVDTLTPLSPAIDPTYAGVVLSTFINSGSTSTVDVGVVAALQITVSAVAKYPGYYLSNNGFLSDAIYLQGNYYQQFSYVLQVEETIDKYRDVVKSLLHPAGMAMFGEYAIKRSYDLSADVVASVGIILTKYANLFSEMFNDTVSIDEVAGSRIIEFTKKLTDIVTTYESTQLELYKYLLDGVVATDSGLIIVNPYFLEDYCSMSYVGTAINF